MTNEQVLQCMRHPSLRRGKGAIEIWDYDSTLGMPDVRANNAASENATLGMDEAKACTVSIAFENGRASHVTFRDPAGGMLASGEHCAALVQSCAN
jgi:hypothetical protein